jgi:hypothetical protein
VPPGSSDHAVLFYDGSELVERVGEFLLGAMNDGGVGVIVAAPDHRTWVNAWLTRAGADLAAARANRSYVVLDADATMRAFMINGRPDPAGFWRTISPVLIGAGGRKGPVRVYGEMVALLWEAGLVTAAIDVEALWNEIGARYSFSLLCGYPAASVAGPEHADALALVCGAHSDVFPSDLLSG